MNKKSIETLSQNSISVICESPFEIQHENGDSATGILADMILKYLSESDNSDDDYFEQEIGTETFLKTSISSLNRLLVKKGIFTEEELIQSFEEESELFIKEQDGNS